jgi:oxepin-CoA hydrolase/3-oxo-5,6-dehydrosuberyl-CoA semialdehyde dehydrogenase
MPTLPFDVNDDALRVAFFGRPLDEALAALRDDAQPHWGRMTAQQMVEHLVWVFETSTGKVQLECAVPEEKRARFRAFLLDNTPLSHDFKNPALVTGLPALRHATLPEARQALRAEVDRFVEQCRSHPGATRMHPVFGPLALQDWERSHYKHTYHHLLQFGLIEG